MNHTLPPGTGRRAIASLWAAAAMPYLVLALWVLLTRALGLAGQVPIPAVVVLAMLAGPALVLAYPRLSARLPATLDPWLRSTPRPLVALWLLGNLLALVLLGRAAIFLGDPTYTACSFDPTSDFLTRHSCLTAYLHGEILSATEGANVYDIAFVEVDPAGALDQPLPPSAAHFAPFTLDAFGYPPPFLLLPRALHLLTRDFLTLRALFAASSLLLALFACAKTASTLGAVAERRIWLLAPFFVANPFTILLLQVGNFHLAAVSLCLLCWVALEQRRDGAAGALLAAATLSKIFPGLLGVVLLMHKRWRAVGATALAALLLCALSTALLGTQIWSDFLFYHLPKVQSGEALGFLATGINVTFNIAPFGVPFKLDALGFEGWGWEQARLFGTLYTVLVFALALLAGRNTGSPQHRLTVWMALVMLGSLRSPYAAPFVLVAVVLHLLFLTAEVRSWRGALALVACYSTFVLAIPLPDPKLDVALSLARTLALYAFLVWSVLRKEQPPLASG